MQTHSIMESNKALLKNMGYTLMLISPIFLLPLLTAIFSETSANDIKWFIITFVISLIIGRVMTLLHVDHRVIKMSIGQDAIFVIMLWFIVLILSTIPYIFGLKMSFLLSLFESVSGWTTTGLSVISVEEVPAIYLLYRSITQFFGGVGLVLILVSALSASFGLRLYNSEGHSDQLMPNLLSSSRVILTIYFGYFFTGSLIYMSLGLSAFDAINHSMAALSTGGFSTHSNSIGFFDSPPVEWFTIILMLLGTTNFAYHLMLLSGKIKKITRLGEMRFLLLLMGLIVPLLSFTLLKAPVLNTSEAVRHGIFQMVSALSTTGFQTTGIENWPIASTLILIILMVIGGGMNSTAGGIKFTRIYVISKSFIWSITDRFRSQNEVKEHYIYRQNDKEFISRQTILDFYNFAFIYLTFLVSGTILLTISGYDLKEALFEFSSALGTVGLSLGITNASSPPLALWTQIFGMVMGRLEIMIFFTAFVKIKNDIQNTLIKKEVI